MTPRYRAPMPLRVVRRARRRLPDATPLAPRPRLKELAPTRAGAIEALAAGVGLPNK